MKTLFILIIIILLPLVISSQTPEISHQNELRIGIWQLFFGRMNLNYEHYGKKGNIAAIIFGLVYS